MYIYNIYIYIYIIYYMYYMHVYIEIGERKRIRCTVYLTNNHHKSKVSLIVSTLLVMKLVM